MVAEFDPEPGINLLLGEVRVAFQRLAAIVVAVEADGATELSLRGEYPMEAIERPVLLVLAQVGDVAAQMNGRGLVPKATEPIDALRRLRDTTSAKSRSVALPASISAWA